MAMADALRQRRDHRDLNDDDWNLLMTAFRAMKGRGEYDAFVNAHHVLFSTGIHGEFFLPWHRDFVTNMELGLRNEGEFDVAIPYWNWEETPEVPTQLSELRRVWGLGLPDNDRIEGLTYAPARAMTVWPQFQDSLGGWPHGRVHVRIGGIMADTRSPADPFFWLHHGYIDKVWSDWQNGENGTDPTNATAIMQRSPALSREVGETINTENLGFIYMDHVA